MSRAHVYATDTVAAPPASVREAWDLLDDARTVVRSRRQRHDDAEESGQLCIGSMFADRFRIERFVARGGAGAVWEATDTRAPRGIEKVALKILTSWSHASTSVLERFRREAEIASELSGPHFPRVVARGFDHDPPYLALELLDGETLAKRLVACGKLTPKECVAIAAGMAAALTEAHALGIVHRDISPTNVFLAKAPDATVKILDFGIAKRDVFDATLTETGMVMGTPHFMSPEQLQKAHTVDFETDLWGMGVVLYRCLLGRPPFLGRAAEVLLKIVGEDPDVPSSFASVGPEIDAFFTTALSKDPKARFPSARAMAAAFEAAVATLSGGDGAVVRARGERSLSPTSTRVTLPELDVTRAYTRETLAAIDAAEVVDDALEMPTLLSRPAAQLYGLPLVEAPPAPPAPPPPAVAEEPKVILAPPPPPRHREPVKVIDIVVPAETTRRSMPHVSELALPPLEVHRGVPVSVVVLLVVASSLLTLAFSR